MAWLHERLRDHQVEIDNRPIMARAIFSRDVSAVDEGAYVTVESFDGGQHEFGPCPWEPRVDATGAAQMPTQGDSALVTEDEDEQPWIVTWWPYDL